MTDAARHALPRNAYLPYPELVEPRRDGAPWTIHDSNDHEGLPSNGITDNRNREIYVPLERSGVSVAFHELAHVRWSPRALPRVRHPIILLQAVEDARINLGLEALGLPFEFDRAQRAQVTLLAANDIKSQRVAAGVVRAVAGLGTGVAQTLYDELEGLPPRYASLARSWVDRVAIRLERSARRADAPVAPFPTARRIARDLARDLERFGLLDDSFDVPSLGCCHVVAAHERSARDGLDWLRFGRGKHACDEGEAGAGIRSGEMHIAEPPLVVRQPVVVRPGLAVWRPATEGTQIYRPDRLALDRAIFRRRVSGGGGTILVDTSGSMPFDASQVEDLTRAAGGAAVVAIYSGRDTKGELRIVARGDRRAEACQFVPFGAGNIVDLPALEWLAKQPEPRLWWSDGGVTGWKDQTSSEISERCLRVVVRGRITQVEDAEAAIRVLEGSRERRR